MSYLAETKKAQFRIMKDKLDFENEKLRILRERNAMRLEILQTEMRRDRLQWECQDLAAEILDIESPYLGLKDVWNMIRGFHLNAKL